jgi:hypothetical protein
VTEAIYVLCALTSLLCAVLLFRGWRTSRQRLLLWSALCFAGLAINNLVMVVDFVLVPHTDLALIRHLTAISSVGVLLYGLVWDAA